MTPIQTRDVRLSNGALLRYQGPAPVAFNAHRFDGKEGLRVLVSDDPTQHGTLRHVSISYPHKNPLWSEIRAIRDAFFPEEVDAAMMLPRRTDYVNFHEHTFHLWQTPTEWGVL